MKKIKFCLLTFISLLIFPNLVMASSGTIKVTGASTAIVGNKVTMTVTLSSSTSIGSWQMDLNYDKTYLQLVSSSAENGGTKMANSSSGTKTKSYTFAFKTLKKGTTSISVSSYLVYDYDSMSEISITPTNKTLKIMTQAEVEATYSKDNNLKSLSVEGYELDKEFHKNTLEYNVTVPTGTTEVKINAQANDSTASISGAGEIPVTEGLNTIKLVVTAQNGDQKTYTLLINVEDQNPINVTLDNSNYTVIKNKNLLEAPLTFNETTININNYEIPAFINKMANITLVGLKDTNGNVILCEYKNNTYTKFNELTMDSLLLIPKPFEEELNLTKTTITINNIKEEVYKYSPTSKLVILNAQDLQTGKTNYYLYDPDNKTAILYDLSFLNEVNKTINNYTYIIMTFALALGLMFIIIIILIYNLRKKQKKLSKFLDKQEAKIEATRKLNDVVEEVKKITDSKKHQVKQDTTELPQKEDKKKDEVKVKEIKEKDLKEEAKEPEVYDLFSDDKKKKKK